MCNTVAHRTYTVCTNCYVTCYSLVTMKSKSPVTAPQVISSSGKTSGTRWNDEDLWFLAELKKASGLTVQSELLRHSIRLAAKHYGIAAPAAKPQRR